MTNFLLKPKGEKWEVGFYGPGSITIWEKVKIIDNFDEAARVTSFLNGNHLANKPIDINGTSYKHMLKVVNSKSKIIANYSSEDFQDIGIKMLKYFKLA